MLSVLLDIAAVAASVLILWGVFVVMLKVAKGSLLNFFSF